MSRSGWVSMTRVGSASSRWNIENAIDLQNQAYLRLRDEILLDERSQNERIEEAAHKAERAVANAVTALQELLQLLNEVR